ncbi:MAG: DUF917 domain-containing protein [Acidobacteria bacterium]|nr:DUF917 domain-containing protein [Acidobacteriota bacterium]
MVEPSRAQQAPPIRVLSEQEVVDLMVGTAIQGTRASNTEQLIKQARTLLAQGRQFRVVSAADIPDDWTVVMAGGGIGGGGAWEYVTERIAKQQLPTVENPTLLAMNELGRHLGKTFDAVIRNEAAGATLNAFQTATLAGLPVVDACPAGRAKPEVQQSVTFINGLSVTPAALVTRWGDTVFIDKTVDDYRYEDIARALAVASGGGISNARGVLSGRDVKRATISGALSEAILFGRTVREASARGEDPTAALVRVANGYPLFRGTVAKAEPKNEGGFNWWDVELAGTGPYRGHTYRIWVKNENMVAWLDGKPDVVSPDLIYNLDPKTGYAISASGLGGYPVGTEVFMMGRAANSPAWRTPKGIEVIGPRHFGFDFDYRPIEDVMKSRPTFER